LKLPVPEIAMSERASIALPSDGIIDLSCADFTPLDFETVPAFGDTAKLCPHSDRLTWLSAKPTSHKLLEFLMALSILWKCRMGVVRYVAALISGVPTKPNCPILEDRLKEFGFDLHQQETIGVFGLRVAKLRLVDMRLATKVRDPTRGPS
jgi:hypothetical protein